MADDVTLRYRLTGEDVSASKALNSVSDKADHTAEKLGGIGKGGIAVGSAIGGLAASGVMALGSLAVSAVQTGLSTESSMQQASIGFETLLGSAQKSKDFVANLSTFAANTPFDFPGLVDSSRTLLGVGVAAKDVVPTLTDFGDAAGALAIDQEHFQGIMLATSQAISAGKFQAGDLNQIMNNGLPVWSILSKAMHKTVPELRDLASHGKLLASDVMPALQAQMHKDYGGAMAKQSQTLSGLWSTMQDTFAQGMAQVLQPLVPLLQAALPGAMSVLGSALGGISGALGGFVGMIKGAKDGFNDLAQADMNADGTLIDDSTNLEIVGGIFQTIGSVIKNVVVDAVKALVQWWRDELMPALHKMADEVMPHIKDAFNSVTTTMHEHQDIINYVKAAFTILGKFITDIVIPTIGQLASWLADLLGPAFKVIAWIISNVVIPVVKFLLTVFLDVVGGVLNGLAKIAGGIPGIGPKLKDAANAFNKFKDDANRALNSINDKTVTVTIRANNEAAVYGSSGGHYVGSTFVPFASGGIVTRPTFAMIGEAGPEAVIPLSGRGGLGGDIHVTINGFMGNEDAIQRQVTDAIRRATTRGYGTAFA